MIRNMNWQYSSLKVQLLGTDENRGGTIQKYIVETFLRFLKIAIMESIVSLYRFVE